MEVVSEYIQVSVRMEISGLWVVRLNLKDVWRFAGMKNGEQCVMISGQLLMQLWLADSLDSLR